MRRRFSICIHAGQRQQNRAHRIDWWAFNAACGIRHNALGEGTNAHVLWGKVRPYGVDEFDLDLLIRPLFIRVVAARSVNEGQIASFSNFDCRCYCFAWFSVLESNLLALVGYIEFLGVDFGDVWKQGTFSSSTFTENTTHQCVYVIVLSMLRLLVQDSIFVEIMWADAWLSLLNLTFLPSDRFTHFQHLSNVISHHFEEWQSAYASFSFLLILSELICKLYGCLVGFWTELDSKGNAI